MSLKVKLYYIIMIASRTLPTPQDIFSQQLHKEFISGMWEMLGDVT